ncbi:MAG: hypothetical protein ACRDGA_14260, partial [Bacteroidota bacterium]
MNHSQLTIPTPPNFNFWRTVYSHGWCSLPPFKIDKEKQTFERILELSDGSLVNCVMEGSNTRLRNNNHAGEQTGFTIQAHSNRPLNAGQKKEIKTQLRQCLRIGDDLSSFYAEARKYRQFRWVPRMGAGRLLRAPTVFEDVVKMICTTNCTWALTEIMVGNITAKLGKKFDGHAYGFPTPKALAGVSEKYMRKEM